MTFTRWNFVAALFVALFLVYSGQELRLAEYDRKFRSQEFANYSLRESLNSFRFEFADDCTWIELDKEHLKNMGIALHRKSDHRPIEVARVYACNNYKDYPE